MKYFHNLKYFFPLQVSFKLSQLGLDHPGGYRATEIFLGEDLGYLKPSDTFTGAVNPTGILLVKFSIVSNHHQKFTESEQELQPEIDVEFPGLTGWKSEF